MARIANIPDRHKRIFARLLKLEQSELTRIIDSLRNAGRHEDSASLADKVAPSLGITPAEVRDVVNLLLSLYTLLQNNDWRELGVSVFVDEVLGRLLMTMEPTPEEARIGALREFLVESLGLDDSLGFVYRLTSLQSEYGSIYINARIMSDIRPSFPSDLGDETEFHEALVVHQLRILYHSNTGEHEEFYVALDSKDLRQLKEAVERAEMKERIVRTQLESKDIQIINLDGLHAH
jgi:DNA-binding MarR family transcriptional regulator